MAETDNRVNDADFLKDASNRTLIELVDNKSCTPFEIVLGDRLEKLCFSIDAIKMYLNTSSGETSAKKRLRGIEGAIRQAEKIIEGYTDEQKTRQG